MKHTLDERHYAAMSPSWSINASNWAAFEWNKPEMLLTHSQSSTSIIISESLAKKNAMVEYG